MTRWKSSQSLRELDSGPFIQELFEQRRIVISAHLPNTTARATIQRGGTIKKPQIKQNAKPSNRRAVIKLVSK